MTYFSDKTFELIHVKASVCMNHLATRAQLFKANGVVS